MYTYLLLLFGTLVSEISLAHIEKKNSLCIFFIYNPFHIQHFFTEIEIIILAVTTHTDLFRKLFQLPINCTEVN